MNQEDPWSQYQSAVSSQNNYSTAARQIDSEDPWSKYQTVLDTKEQTAKNDKGYQSYLPEGKTPEELKKMSVSERMQYAQDLNRATEYLKSKGFTKGLLSGASLGASEMVDALKPEEHELGHFAGESVGAGIPIALASMGISPILGAVLGNAPKLLQLTRPALHGFGTGSLYETGKQGVNALTKYFDPESEKEFDPYQIPKTGAQFAAFETGMQALGGLKNLVTRSKPADIERMAMESVGREPTSSLNRSTSQQLLEELTAPTTAESIIANRRDIGKPLTGRVIKQEITKPTHDLGIKPAPEETTSLKSRVGKRISDERIYNTTRAGEALKSEIETQDKLAYQKVNDLYSESRALNKDISEIQPQLVDQLMKRADEIRSIPHPSGPQKKLLQTIDDILHDAAVIENGQVTGYKPVNNQTLIDQVQSTRQIVDFDFAHGNTNGIFKPLIEDLQNSAIKTAERVNPEAAAKFNEARKAYREWSNEFNNDYINKYRDISNKDYSKLAKQSMDLDEFNIVNKQLQKSDSGKKLSDAIQREIVEEKLGKYVKDPKNINMEEFSSDLRELESVVSKDKLQEVENLIRAEKKPLNRKAKIIETNAAKFFDKSEFEIRKLMDTPKGIRELKNSASKTKQGKELFNKMGKQKIQDILRENHIEKDFNGKDLYDILNKKENFEKIVEIISEEEAEALRQASKEIADRKFTVDNVKKYTVNPLLKLKALKWVLAVGGI